EGEAFALGKHIGGQRHAIERGGVQRIIGVGANSQSGGDGVGHGDVGGGQLCPTGSVGGVVAFERRTGAHDFDPIGSGHTSEAAEVDGACASAGAALHADAVAGCDVDSEVTGVCGGGFADHHAGFCPRAGGTDACDACDDGKIGSSGAGGVVELIRGA